MHDGLMIIAERDASPPSLPMGDTILFSENGGAGTPLPNWARAFIALGYSWRVAAGTRRIAFVSTPCESPAAGLIALGAVLRRLEEPSADDLSGHLSRLLDLTPETAGGVILRHRLRTNRTYEVVRDEKGTIQFQERNKTEPARYRLLESNASNWYFDGEPPVEAHRGARLPHAALYEALLPINNGLRRENLRHTDSYVVLAGRSGGRSVTEGILSAVQLRTAAGEASLSELLAVHGWQPRNVSRVRYFNPRSGAGSPFDRSGSPPGLVIVDGPGAFEAVRACRETDHADIVAVVPRTVDPDQLEAIAVSAGNLTQWYELEADPAGHLPPLPTGVEIVTLRRRG